MVRTCVLGLCLAACIAAPARAAESPFGYSYTAETEAAGETELSLWATDRRGKEKGSYKAQDYRLELEHGFTERFQIAAYVNAASHHLHGVGAHIPDVQRSLAFDGASVEFKYRLLDQARNGMGFAIYAEPGWSRIHDVEGVRGAEYELELKAIFSRSFADDRLLWAANLTAEPEWERDANFLAPGVTRHAWEKELKLQATTGVAYRLGRNWSAGIEGRYASVYPDWTRALHRDAAAVSVGPTIAFSSNEWSASLTFLPQLFGAGTPGSRRSLDEFEKREIRLRVSHEF